MFVGTQQRITINNNHYYADMVFYNKQELTIHRIYDRGGEIIFKMVYL